MSMRVLSKATPAARAYIRYASTESATQKAAQQAMDRASSTLNSAANTLRSQGITKTLCNFYQSISKPIPASIKSPLSKVAGMLEPVIYYSEVAYHLGKQVVVRQSFTLPGKADFAVVEAQLFKALDLVKINNVKALKDIPAEKWKSGAIKTFELSALFVIGEIVGRGNLIGYKD
ncbi:hypothetical protein GGI04_002075 [Coemansia thaxteri]|nr:hypothetical protein GGI04_002075 [Coemansia thaxteri]KAJ2471370.1 hypothetical protein EV174_005970 [Coemansia sp. RSA 2320]KAJ2473640.1 hypothetical protein GGI02_000698 [Coemansia sp. RSA 2322]